MENKIIFLIVAILVLWLMFTNKGKDLINNSIFKNSSSSSNTYTENPKYKNNVAGDKQTPYDGNSSTTSIFGGGLTG